LDELCQAVREYVKQGHAIYAQGGLTAIDYGDVPLRPGVAIDLRSLAQVVDYPHADMTVTVQAGITANALRAILAQQNQRLLIDVPQGDKATLGGVYATNTSGPRRLGLGRPRDQIIGVSFVTSEGVEVKGGGRVVKNVAGYDFPKLLTGSLGTLGIITQMTLKVRPIPVASVLAWMPAASLDAAGDALDALNVSGARPVALELLNRPAALEIGVPLSLPASHWVVVIGLEDNAASVRWQTDRLIAELGRPDVEVRRDAAAASLWSALIEQPAAAPGPVSCFASVRPSRVAHLLDQLDPARWSVQAHAGNGVVRLHALGEWSLQQAEEEIARLRARAVQDDGSLIVTRCPTSWKARCSVWGPPRPDWALAKRVKQALDPRGAMNPGRFVNNA
jgi:glycolate oxidase FAD binding subunit